MRRARQLQIIDWATWKAARRRRRERATLFPEGSRGRAAVYPSRLLSLACGGCGAALVLGKSGQYAMVRCPNAAEGKEGCTFAGYKSLRKVEGPVLKFLSERLSDPSYGDLIVAEANEAIAELAKAPKPEVGPLEDRVRELRDVEKRLLDAVETGGGAVAALVSRLGENQARLAEARARLAEAKAASAAPPEPVTAEEVAGMLSDLRGLLGAEAAVAAPVLRELLGDVTVSQEVEPGREKPVWYVEFHLRGLKAFSGFDAGRAKAGRDHRLKFALAGAGATERVRVRLDPPAKPEKPKAEPPYVRISAEAARLRDEGFTFAAIGRRLGVHETTVMRAHDHARPGERPAKGHKRPQGGRAQLVRRRIAVLLADGWSPEKVASEVGCSAMTVHRVARAVRKQARGADVEAA